MTLEGPHGSEGNYLFIAEGRVEGAITGRLRGVQPPALAGRRQRLPDAQGAIG